VVSLGTASRRRQGIAMLRWSIYFARPLTARRPSPLRSRRVGWSLTPSRAPSTFSSHARSNGVARQARSAGRVPGQDDGAANL